MPQYEILEILGRGGMGVVYKATDTVLHRTVAIKVFHENLVKQEVVIKRFLRESTITAQLDHPHIVKVYNFERQAGQSFLVMELIQGKPLLDYIEEQQLSLEAKLKILIKIANALHYAHRKNIIHRDIKPSNIMVRTNGEPVVMDFGIAKCIGLDELTRTGEFVGTIQYVSPEQAEGKRRELDHRTDIYSLGAVMYHILVGKSPVEATTFNEMLYQLSCEPPTPPRKIHPEISIAIEQICLKALAKDKTQRYASAQEFADDIQNYLAGKKTKAVGWSKQQLWKRWLLRSSLLLGIVFVLLAAAFGSYWYSQQQKIVQQQTALISKIKILQTQIESQKEWSLDQLELWQQAYKNGKEAYELYLQHHQWFNTPELATQLPNDLAACSYKIGIHQWVEDPLQSITPFSSVLSISLPKEHQSVKMRLAILATDMHLQYLRHHYHEVCENFVSFQKLFKNRQEIFNQYPEIAFLVAKSHYHCQQYEDTQKYLQALTIPKNFMQHPKIKAEVLYYQGMCHYHKDQYSQALENFQNSNQACNEYQKPVDFGISLLIYLGDCQSQLIPYSERISSQQRLQFEQILNRLDKKVDQLPPRSIELALYYELYARYLLTPIDNQDPAPEQIKQALALIAKSASILPCRYTQYLLRGIAFRYQGRTNVIQYHQAWQEFHHAYQLNPQQADSVAFTIDLASEYINFSRDQVSDLIMQLYRWNTRMEIVASDFDQPRTHQLELKCHSQLQKLVGIPYEEKLAEKFYNDLQSPVDSIRLLARSSLLDLVSYKDGFADHKLTYNYLKQKLQQLEPSHPFQTTLSAILQEIDKQAEQEATWQHLYFLVRIPYRGKIPDIVLSECNQRSGFISFLMQILLDHDCQIIPELKSSWLWFQYLAARVFIQLPYPLSEETLSRLPEEAKFQNVYARQILYDMITAPVGHQAPPPLFCLIIAKALQDARFLWWNRSLLYRWFYEVWDELRTHSTSENLWLQTNIAALFIKENDKTTRDVLAQIYQQTKSDLVKAWIIHEMPKYENSFLPEQVIPDWYRFLTRYKMQQPRDNIELTQLRIINIMNTKTICWYIAQQSRLKAKPNQEKEQKEEFLRIANLLANFLQDNTEDIKIHKAVMSTMLLSWDLDHLWISVSNTNRTFADAISKLLTSPDQETRLLAIAVMPLLGESIDWKEFANQTFSSPQLFVEKIALFYGLANEFAKNKGGQVYEQSIQNILDLLLRVKDPRTVGWIFTILCHFRSYVIDRMDNEQYRMAVNTKIFSQILDHLNSESPDLMFWTLVSITKLDEYNQYIYNKISKMLDAQQFRSHMLETLSIGILLHLATKYNLTEDHKKWSKLSYEKLQNPEFRPYLSLLVWSYLQILRNNDLNHQLHKEALGREEEIAIQDIHWLRYKKNLLDTKFRSCAKISLQSIVQLFYPLADNLNILEKEQLQQTELMLAELYYTEGNIVQGNQILEQKNKHQEQLSAAMLWLENNPQRVHEIWPIWDKKNQQNAKDTQRATMHDAAMFLRMTAIQHSQEKKQDMAVQDLTEAALLESREPKAWVLLFDSMLAAQQSDNALKLIQEAHTCGFYQARTHWALARYYAQYGGSAVKAGKIREMLDDAGSPWEYPITLKMLEDLNCEGMPSAELCYRLAYNHAENNWHYEACFWLKEAAQRNYKLSEDQIKGNFGYFKKYKTKKYQVYAAQAAIKKMFESK